MSKRTENQVEDLKHGGFNLDGTPYCFGKADFYNDGTCFHCAQIAHIGDCSDLIRRQCWELSKTQENPCTAH